MKIAVIGGGPAGLMAAEVLAQPGLSVSVFDAKPSLGRKFLMAGKSGLNLTMDVGPDDLTAPFTPAQIAPMVRAFDAEAVQDWARGLGQSVFSGSTGRVFPEVMKASPLLRAWLRRSVESGVEMRPRWRWQGWDDGALAFDTPEGLRYEHADATVLALGGASWARLGSDGLWAGILRDQGVKLTAFSPSNAALQVKWSPYMEKHFGAAIKSVAWRTGDHVTRGEAILSARGLEGGGIYGLSSHVRAGVPVSLDLMPDLSLADVEKRISRPRGKASLSNHLRKSLGLPPVKLALLHEWGGRLGRDPAHLAHVIKHLTVMHSGFRPIDEAISTTGGVPFAEMDPQLMLHAMPGVFCAGEMIDWDAPTGGYLLNGCFATGRWAAHGVLRYLGRSR